MAFDSALTRAVSALLCRVAASRAVHRLLVVLGILAAGWLLGSAAQAHADGPSAPDASRVVADTPVVGGAVRAAQKVADHESRGPRPSLPVRKIVRGAVKAQPVEPAVPVTLPAAVPPVPGLPGAAPQKAAPAAAEVTGSSWAPQRPVQQGTKGERAHARKGHQGAPPVSGASKTTRAGVAAPAMPAAPLPAFAEAGTVLPAGGMIMIGGIGAPLARRVWAVSRPQGVLPHASGAVPPAVRTAADEPSFAPD